MIPYKFGVCTWIYGDMSLVDVAGHVAGFGYDGVEFAGDIARTSPAEVRRILDAHGLAVLSLTPQNVDLAHPSAYVRAEALDYYYRLLDFAAQVGSPRISCHGAVGRIRPVGDYARERALLVDGIRRLASRAGELGLSVAVELLNRYESHLLNNVTDALAALREVGLSNVGLNLDAYHMNIEEPDPVTAIRMAGHRLAVFHVADSNRQAVGRGHTNFSAIFAALRGAAFCGPIIVECTPPGPDPFRAVKDAASIGWVDRYLAESLADLRVLAEA